MKQFPFMRPELNSALLCFCFVYLTKIERHFSQFCFCDTCFSFTTVFSSTPVSGTVITVQPISFTEQGSGAVAILLNIVFLCHLHIWQKILSKLRAFNPHQFYTLDYFHLV